MIDVLYYIILVGVIGFGVIYWALHWRTLVATIKSEKKKLALMFGTAALAGAIVGIWNPYLSITEDEFRAALVYAYLGLFLFLAIAIPIKLWRGKR